MKALPKNLTLPSGAVVQLRRGAAHEATPLAPGSDAPLFEETLTAVAKGRVRLTKDGAPVDLRAMVLRDFHVVRAVLARSGVIAEDELEVRCRNCAEPMRIRPCAALEIGPWVFGELGDPELDRTLPLGEPIAVPALPLGRVRTARSVTFEDRTVEDAMPLFTAAAKKHLAVDAAVVQALGIVALGAESDPERIAEALAQCDEAAFAAVSDAFLATHYAPRLACIAFCGACGARNDIDAPYERELFPASLESGGRSGDTSTAFPDVSAFVARAREIARPLLNDAPADPDPLAAAIEVVIEEGTPAVDDGGEPLLGSYVPPHPGDATTPSRAPVVTVYYRSFRAMWDEEGPYDWADELAETIEHELEHHVYFLRGEDPMDDEERAVIRDEAVRIVGRREAGRRELVGFGASLREFVVRTWPLWLIAVLAAALTLATQR